MTGEFPAVDGCVPTVWKFSANNRPALAYQEEARATLEDMDQNGKAESHFQNLAAAAEQVPTSVHFPQHVCQVDVQY